MQRYQREQQAGILRKGCKNIMVRIVLCESKLHENRDYYLFGSLLYTQKCFAHSRSLTHACWMNGEVQNVTRRVGSYGTGQGKSFEMRGRRVAMIKLLNDSYLLFDASVKTEKSNWRPCVKDP